ncbi:A disintegrin and metalloproteinase with thrombospondin motifs 13 isoform X2 [Xiphophorus maculatus]|uniref:A disintegrin and metalloproteinase with thrombospondin motifs 13 isoform X2 n=1 Tax=Xiphophorus maculatus TaxID=8083 RepID=UPI000C6DC9A7|nr:A disintegrin and metalloproteinase with thrombospondin motifs 13 isoform X2 [Xiphophorus maculatus]
MSRREHIYIYSLSVTAEQVDTQKKGGEKMFILTAVCLLLLLPGFSALMGSPQDEPQEKVSALDSSADTTVSDRLRRSTLIPDITHLELLVVVGPDVQQVHKQDTERYILTNLNIASELLRDMTLGANMRVHLVRMIILSEPEPEIQMSTNITSSLRSVCDWGRRINPSNDSDPLHADLLLYITRYDLELPNGNKQVRGVTQLGGVCSSNWSCVITEDTGFDLGITIAHEVGHSFGIDHDGSANGCSRSGFMMASDGGYNSVDLTWSPCSRHQLLTFFSEGRAECVKDFPALGGSLQDWKPGLYYGVDDQCRIAFGSTARACSFSNPDLPACRTLSCHVEPQDISSCKRLLVPLLDGTECAPNQWCLKGRCVSPDDFGVSVVVNGSWSSWSGFSSCSRTCGGGVMLRTRECNNPRPAFGGNDCDGPDIEAELCNQLPCEQTQLDFVAEQCSQTDPQPLYLLPNTASFYKWIPAIDFVKGDEQCRYMCQSDGERFIVSRGSYFADGTRCKSDISTPYGATAACLQGRCQVFGCDGVLHSGKAWDVCGVCGGDGSTCILTSDSYSGGGAKDYNTFLTLPVNATQVHIVNRAPVFTHLAMMVGDQYIVSGSGTMALNTTHPSPLDDDYVQYRLHLTPDLLPEMEEVVVPGPLKQEMTIQVYRKYGKEYGEKTNPNISFQFYVPRNKSLTDSSPRGKWAPLATPCSVTCGLGIQKNEHVCIDEDTNKLLKPHYCKAPPPPTALHTTCQLPSCPPRWDAGNFGVCSASCGGGFRVRHVRCVQKHESDVVKVPDSECSADTAPHPLEKCNLHHCPARWSVSEPGNCSAVCGPGEAERNVSCIRQEDGLDVEVDHSFCLNQIKPPYSVPCVVDVCPIGWDSKERPSLKSGLLPRSRQAPVYVWSPVVSQCSRSCGNGNLQVWFSCVDHQTRLGVPDFHCDSSSKPDPHTEMCGFSPCPPKWRSKQGVCSVTCGGGVAKRVLYCARETDGEEEEVLEDYNCRGFPKPTAVVSCNTHSCPARWKVFRTSPCSVSCDLGVAQRNVSCVQFVHGKESVVPEDGCRAAVKPATTVPCLVQVCTYKWEVKPWSQCSSSCGYGIQSRAVSCMGPPKPEPLSPLFCMHMPKPITIRGCDTGSCRDVALNKTTQTLKANSTEKALPSPPPVHKDASRRRMGSLPPRPTETMAIKETTTATPTPKPNACGLLLLEESGTVDLHNAPSRCTVSVGRPLDEVISITLISSSLDCRKREYVAFFDRLAIVRKCVQAAGSELTTRTNVLLVRQSLVTPGNGVVFTYRSKKNTKRSHHQDCDIQLFSPSGIFENPVTSNTSRTCRVLINAPPSVKIRVQALHIALPFNTTSAQSTYIMIRDMDVLKTNVFNGQQLFLWHSSGNMAEVEFHGDYLYSQGTFRAEYSFVRL